MHCRLKAASLSWKVIWDFDVQPPETGGLKCAPIERPSHDLPHP